MTAAERRWTTLVTLVFAAALLLPASLRAQYFGRNQVRYKSFDFKVLATEHYDVYYYPGEEQLATDVGRMAERWYSRLSRLLDDELTGRQPIILYDTRQAYDQTNIANVAGSEGVTEPFRRRVVLFSGGPLAATDHVVGHELTHAFQYDISGIEPKSPLFGAPAMNGLPLWMTEGMAEYMSKGSDDPLTATWIRDALGSDQVKLPSLGDLENTYKYFPYRWGQALWAYIAGVWGDTAVQRIYRIALRTGRAAPAIEAVTGLSADTVVARWHEASKKEWGPLLETTSRPDSFGTRIIEGSRDRNPYNVGPSLSPDGKRLAYLSTRGRFSIELYLADARTGKTIRQITKTTFDPHLGNLEFESSSGAWAPDSRRFALAAVSGATPVLAIYDMDNGHKLKELPFKSLGQIYTPAWSPDGHTVAFTGMAGGLVNLYVVDIDSGRLTQLTHDPYAEMEPVWSPDGSRIAFVTDRFGSSLEHLDMNHYRLATMAAGGGDVQPLPSFDHATNINPVWTADGQAIYFISDPTGIPDIYRADVGSGQITRVTNVLAGVGGITELSPALSVATGTGDVAFSAFVNGAFSIYRIDDARVLAGKPISDSASLADAGQLPPVDRAGSEVATLLSNPTLGLPDTATFQQHDYNSALGLDYIAQPSLGAGISSFGSYIGGGAAFLWGDMLGNHSLITQIQLQIINGNVVNGLGGLATYVNRTHRLNWGVQAGQVPQFSQYYAGGYVQQNNQILYEIQTYNFWQTDRRALGLAIYPLSSVLRLEFQGGFEQLGFHAETQTELYDPNTGQRLYNNTVSAPACGDSLNFFTSLCNPGNLNEALASAALVFDNSISGPTGPIVGHRFRLEADPSAGTLNYVGALADFREYLMPVWPITLAGRIMHYGRYGSGSGDNRLGINFLGYPTLVRGYDYGSFSTTNCPQTGSLSNCREIQVYNELFGSRMAVANGELRIPITGPIGLAHTGSAVPPLDLFGFADAGVAWGFNALNGKYQPFNISRYAVTSAGFGGRINLFGFAVGEVYWVHPFDRPGKGNYVGFALTPAF